MAICVRRSSKFLLRTLFVTRRKTKSKQPDLGGREKISLRNFSSLSSSGLSQAKASATNQLENHVHGLLLFVVGCTGCHKLCQSYHLINKLSLEHKMSLSTHRALAFMKRFKSTLAIKAINAFDTPKPGHIHNKRPFRYHCKAGRSYMWCTCGWSRTQPFCDGTHHQGKMRISHKPLRFDCTETKDYWFCQCKQTKDRPFCDGSHEDEPVKSAQKITITYDT